MYCKVVRNMANKQLLENVWTLLNVSCANPSEMKDIRDQGLKTKLVLMRCKGSLKEPKIRMTSR